MSNKSDHMNQDGTFRRGFDGNPVLLNRDFNLPADDWYQATPVADVTRRVQLKPDGKPQTITQVLDAAMAEAVVNSFRQDALAPNFPGLLVDYDHFSTNTDHPSEAAGWITDTQNRAGELWLKIRWTDEGRKAVEGGRYRMLSPVWLIKDCEDLGGGRLRPRRLDSCALTNDPALTGMVPLSNRADVEEETQNGGKTMDYKGQLLTLLGLAPAATDMEVEAAVVNHGGLSTRLVDVEKERDALKLRVQKADEAEVDRVLDEHKDIITDRAAARETLLGNRESGLKLLGLVKKTPAAEQLKHRRADAQAPAQGATSQVSPKDFERMNLVKSIRNRDKSDFETAWETARREKPELFKEEE